MTSLIQASESGPLCPLVGFKGDAKNVHKKKKDATLSTNYGGFDFSVNSWEGARESSFKSYK